ncbi:MAG: hypothetical protein QP761_01945 [Campylobacter ureolyticus]|nr:hypothetical protein [Campylobacter ureolyticus]MDK8322666.1 hypothetical protein [Campylobacter ureolyticus]
MFQEKTIQSSIKNLDENKLLKAYDEFITEFTKALKLKLKINLMSEISKTSGREFLCMIKMKF